MNLVKTFSVYTMVRFINKGIAIFLLPILTTYLSTEDYGTLALMSSYILIAGTFINLGANGAILREFYSRSKEALPTYINSALKWPFIMFIIFLAFSLLFGNPLGGILKIPGKWVWVIPCIAMVQVVYFLTLGLYRNREQPFHFAALNMGKFLLEITLSVILVIYVWTSWKGRILGIGISFVTVTVVCFYLLHRMGYLRWNRKKVFTLSALSFGLPLIPHELSKLIINYSDRIFIANFEGLEATGVYSVGYQIGSVITLINAGFASAFSPWVFKLLTKKPDGYKNKIVKVSLVYLAVLAGVFGLLIVFTPVLFKWFVGTGFQGGSIYVFWVALSYYFWAGYLIFVPYVYFHKKTKMLAFLAIWNVVLNLVLNYFLIKEYGPIGAAYATTITFATVCILAMFISHRIQPMPWLSFYKRNSD